MATVASPTPRRRRRPGVLAACITALTLVACGPAGTDTGDAELPDEAVLTAAQAPRAEVPDAPEPEDTGAPADVEELTAADSHAEVGDLVAGFPVELLPLPGDAVLLVTSAVPVGSAEVQEVSLNLRTGLAAEDVMELYRGTLLEAGFEEAPAVEPAEQVVAETLFTRSGGDELVSIGVLDVDGGRTVTIGGRVHTGQ
ncbi:hypothetical protein [Cellulomonas bogoriensis]